MSLVRTAAYAAMRAVAPPARTVIGRRGLRILAYHGVPDRELFRNHIAHLVRWYTPVDGPTGLAAIDKPPVWVTFDDGDPTIIDVALGILMEFDVTATAFICPGVIDTDQPFWWQVVDAAARTGVTVAGSKVQVAEVGWLKQVPEPERRARVDAIHEALVEQTGETFRSRQLTEGEVRTWVEAGNSVGNHTWDHPILPQCSPEEQEQQIVTADEWLNARGLRTTQFAYPNGDWSGEAEASLRRHGYEIGLLFDHRIADKAAGLRMSRVRVNGTDSMNEFIAKVSGVHPALMNRDAG